VLPALPPNFLFIFLIVYKMPPKKRGRKPKIQLDEPRVLEDSTITNAKGAATSETVSSSQTVVDDVLSTILVDDDDGGTYTSQIG